MKTVRLGRTELYVTKTAMGCLPIQRCSTEDAVQIVRRAYEGGINFFDTANNYSDSEEKVGLALSPVRKDVIIATKSASDTAAGILEHIELSLRRLRTDYIDLFQFHCVPEMPDFDDPEGAYAGALEAQRRGWIRHVGVTAHKIELAFDLIETGRFETMQFPFSYLSGEREEQLVARCGELDMGYIAMKGLAGGLLTNARACHAFMKAHENVVPIWGVQTMDQINEWLAVAEEDPDMNETFAAEIAQDRKQLAANFCRGCGYCMPCPQEIEIQNVARMDMLLRRSPWQQYMSDEWYEKMHRINDCLECRRCVSHCPYGLDIPSLLQYQLKDYDQFCTEHKPLL